MDNNMLHCNYLAAVVSSGLIAKPPIPRSSRVSMNRLLFGGKPSQCKHYSILPPESHRQADTLLSPCGCNEPAYQEINVKFSAVKATTPRTVGQSNWNLAGMGTLSTDGIYHAGKGGSYAQ